jgi:hypothetical protein
MRSGLFISSTEDLSTQVDMVPSTVFLFFSRSSLRDPSKSRFANHCHGSLCAFSSSSGNAIAFHIRITGSYSAMSKAWTRAVTGDAMYSYVPSTQVRYPSRTHLLIRIYMWNRNVLSNYFTSSGGSVQPVYQSTSTTGSIFSSCKYSRH